MCFIKVSKHLVVVAQLVEQLLTISEVRSLNPFIGKNLYLLNICLLLAVF